MANSENLNKTFGKSNLQDSEKQEDAALVQLTRTLGNSDIEEYPDRLNRITDRLHRIDLDQGSRSHNPFAIPSLPTPLPMQAKASPRIKYEYPFRRPDRASHTMSPWPAVLWRKADGTELGIPKCGCPPPDCVDKITFEDGVANHLSKTNYPCWGRCILLGPRPIDLAEYDTDADRGKRKASHLAQPVHMFGGPEVGGNISQSSRFPLNMNVQAEKQGVVNPLLFPQPPRKAPPELSPPYVPWSHPEFGAGLPEQERLEAREHFRKLHEMHVRALRSRRRVVSMHLFNSPARPASWQFVPGWRPDGSELGIPDCGCPPHACLYKIGDIEGAPKHLSPTNYPCWGKCAQLKGDRDAKVVGEKKVVSVVSRARDGEGSEVSEAE